MYVFQVVNQLRFTNFNNFKVLGGIHRFTRNEFYTKCVKQLNPLALITGFSPVQIRFCMMHIVHLGICQWLNAGAVHELNVYGYFGPGALSEQLHVMTQRLNQWCSMNRIRWGGKLLALIQS